MDVLSLSILKILQSLQVKQGEITVSFDSNNKPGNQQKSVTLSANTASGREMLRIKSLVTPDPVKQQQREAQAKARQ